MRKALVLAGVLSLACLNHVNADGCISVKGNRIKLNPLSAGGTCPKAQLRLADLAANGAVGVTGATGPTGATGATGTARAYAFIKLDGTVDTARSSSNVSVSKVGTGVFCVTVTGISPTSVLPLVSADYSTAAGSYHAVQIQSSGAGCSADAFRVLTYNINAGTESFQDQNFTFLIP